MKYFKSNTDKPWWQTADLTHTQTAVQNPDSPHHDTAPELPNERVGEHKLSIRPPNSSDPNPINSPWNMLEQVRSIEAPPWIGLLVTVLSRSAVVLGRSHPRECQDWRLPNRTLHCDRMVGVVTFICLRHFTVRKVFWILCPPPIESHTCFNHHRVVCEFFYQTELRSL